MSDIAVLQSLIKNFCEARDWDQFHSPKDLAIGVSTEAAELLELFRFKSDAEIKELMLNTEFREKLNDEVADVFFFILRMSQMNNIDLTAAVKNKMEKNGKRYTVENSKGSNKKA